MIGDIRRRIMNRVGVAPTLPTDFQQVEYIQSVGSQFIDFNINCNKLELIWSFTTLDNQFVLGAGYIGNEIYIWSKIWDGIFRGITTNPRTDVTYTAILGGISTLYENGNLIGEVGYFRLEGTVRLNSMNREGSYGYIGKNKFYSVSAYLNDVCTLNLIPCYRKADNEAGMYDIVNNQFYTNAGTGKFLVGADVN